MRNILMATLVLVSSAQAAVWKDVTLPDSVTVDGKNLILNGIGVREATILKVKVYVAGFYLPKKTDKDSEILASTDTKVMEMTFVREVDEKKIRSTWNDALEENCTDHCKEVDKSKAEFLALFSAVKKGDRLRYVFTPAGVEVLVNGTSKGKLANPALAQTLLHVWFGPNPPNESLKKGLLGKS